MNLKPKALETLISLVSRHGEVVSKEELITEVWPDTFVEENSLTRNIHEIRKSLARHSGEDKEYIQTVPKAGYRFVGEIIKEDSERNGLEDLQTAVDVQNRDSEANKIENPGVRWYLVGILIISVLLFASFSLWINLNDDESGSQTPVGNRQIKSIAVMPVRELGNSKNGKLVSLGLTDTLIARLGSLNRFVVRPFSAVAEFAETNDVVLAGKKLNVDAVMEGTLQATEKRYKVTLKLIDVRDGSIIWTANFDETASDVFKLQDALSLQAANSLANGLTDSEKDRLLKTVTKSDEAYLLYMKGRELWLRRSKSEEIPFFKAAIKLDPDFALAHLGLADALVFEENPEPAENALNRAIELDPTLEGAHATKGFIQMFHKWDWDGAESSLLKSLQLSPNSAKSHHWYGVFLGFQKRFDEAEKHFEKALEIDPTSFGIRADTAQLYYFRKNFDEARSRLRGLLKEDPKHPLSNEYMDNLLMVTDLEGEIRRKMNEKIDEYRTQVSRSPSADIKIKSMQAALDSNDAKRLYRSYEESVLSSVTEDKNLFRIASYYALVGKREKCLETLEQAVAKRIFLLPIAAIDPVFEPFHNEPRFTKVVLAMDMSLDSN